MFTHKESGKSYIGSAVDLSKRLRCYYSIAYITRIKSMLIYKALLKYGYSAFNLTILEYIDIAGLSITESKELIISREQNYLDSCAPEYNILKVAGSPLGFKHSAKTLTKLSEIRIGKTHSAETIAKIRKAKIGWSMSTETPFGGPPHPAVG